MSTLERAADRLRKALVPITISFCFWSAVSLRKMTQTLKLETYSEEKRGGCKVNLKLGTPKSLKTLCCHFSIRPIDSTREFNERTKSSAIDNHAVKTDRLTRSRYGKGTCRCG